MSVSVAACFRQGLLLIGGFQLSVRKPNVVKLNPAWAVWSMRMGGGYLTAFAASSVLVWLLAQPVLERASGARAHVVVLADHSRSMDLPAERHGGSLTRIEIQRAAPVGGLTAWRPALPVTQLVLNKGYLG